MFSVMANVIATLNRRQHGQGLVEYGLIIALVSVAAVAALNTLAGDVSGVLTGIGGTLAAAV